MSDIDCAAQLELAYEEIADLKRCVETLRGMQRMDNEPAEPHALASFREGVPLGLYIVHWKSGGTSVAAIGMLSNGDRWIAPTNWVRPALFQADGGWGDIDKLERIELDVSTVARISAERDEAIEALRPFAAVRSGIGPYDENIWFIHDGEMLMIGDFSRAAAIVAKHTKEQENQA